MMPRRVYWNSVKIALIGYGNVARGLVRILREKRAEHSFEIVGIHRRQGSVCGVFDPENPIFLPDRPTVHEFLDRCKADVLVELTTLNPESGQPAISYIQEALRRRMHVVSANKGPVAFAYDELAAHAKAQGVRYLYESAVMDGAPVFNMVRHTLPGVKILGFTGVLNSTTKLIIDAMECGASFEDGVKHAQRLGVAEENYEYDTQGWDAAAKTAALANVFLGAKTTPAEVVRQGIHGFTAERVRTLASQGQTVRLVSRGEQTADGIKLQVKPEILPRQDLLASVGGTSNLILLHTDRMGTLGTISISPIVEHTAYGVYIDLLELVRYPLT